MKTSWHHQSGTVIIVDDETSDIRLTQRVISTLYPELDLKGLRSGEELIKYLEGQNQYSDRDQFPKPILILLDLKMPGMHGFDVLRWLANNPPHNSIRTVVLTVSGEVPMAQYAYQLGAKSFLTKPLTADDFQNMMTTFEEDLKFA